MVGAMGLGVIIGFIGQRNVRHVEIFWKEKVEQTVAFEDVNGEVQLKGITGELNPHLISRTSYSHILTVVNNGDKHHRLYTEGLEIQSNLLESGQQDVIAIYPTEERLYKYYDKRKRLEHLGFLEIKTVVPSDKFTGFLRNVI